MSKNKVFVNGRKGNQTTSLSADIVECRSCRQPIFFLETKIGSRMPCDVPPWVEMPVWVSGKDGWQFEVVPHWATCDNPDHFRKG